MADIKTRIKNPRERVYLAEILAEVSKLKKQEEKIELLHLFFNKNSETNRLMVQFMECMFHSKVVMELPEGVPPFSSDHKDFNLAPMQLLAAFKRVPYFVSTQSQFVQSASKRESIFIQTLESLHTPDALIYCMLKDKQIDKKIYPGVTAKVLLAAFPDIVPEEMLYTKKPGSSEE